MANLPLPPQDKILQRLRYCAFTGKLFWKIDPEKPKNWNSRWSGREAFTTNERGYLQGRIDWKLYYAHRIIWKMVTGEDPDDIDHINGNRSDNRWLNLRNVTRSENLKNRAISRNNTSGKMGVEKTKWGTWKSSIGHQGKSKSLGSFAAFDEASAARELAERELGYHKNHGRMQNENQHTRRSGNRGT